MCINSTPCGAISLERVDAYAKDVALGQQPAPDWIAGLQDPTVCFVDQSTPRPYQVRDPQPLFRHRLRRYLREAVTLPLVQVTRAMFSCANAVLYLSVRRSRFRGKRWKHRQCSRMVMGSGAATVGICKVMGQWSKEKCALGWVSPRTGGGCVEMSKWSRALKYPCGPTQVGSSTWGGGCSP